MKILYHGTMSKNLDKIKHTGLKINSSNNKHIHGYDVDGQISLSSSYQDAFYYASLFANQNPITILIIKIDETVLKKGTAFNELVSKMDILPEFIIGAYDEEKIIKLKHLNVDRNYINYELLTGADKRVALKQYNNIKMEFNMKISKILTERSFSKYEEFQDALMAAKEKNNYNEFKNILETSLKNRQYDWFGRYFQFVNRTGKLTKDVFDLATPF